MGIKPIVPLKRIFWFIFLLEYFSLEPMALCHWVVAHNKSLMCGIIKQIFNYAVDAEYIEKSPYRVNVNKKKVVRAKKKENTTEIFFPDEQKLILDEMERRLRNNPTNTAPLAIKLDFELGVRKGELLALRYSDIKDGKIHGKLLQISLHSNFIHLS